MACHVYPSSTRIQPSATVERVYLANDARTTGLCKPKAVPPPARVGKPHPPSQANQRPSRTPSNLFNRRPQPMASASTCPAPRPRLLLARLSRMGLAVLRQSNHMVVHPHLVGLGIRNMERRPALGQGLARSRRTASTHLHLSALARRSQMGALPQHPLRHSILVRSCRSRMASSRAQRSAALVGSSRMVTPHHPLLSAKQSRRNRSRRRQVHHPLVCLARSHHRR